MKDKETHFSRKPNDSLMINTLKLCACLSPHRHMVLVDEQYLSFPIAFELDSNNSENNFLLSHVIVRKIESVFACHCKAIDCYTPTTLSPFCLRTFRVLSLDIAFSFSLTTHRIERIRECRYQIATSIIY